MSLRDLREKYKASQSRQAINRAIRAEIPGGDLILDRMELWHKIALREGWKDAAGRDSLPALAYKHFLELAELAEEEIRKRYQIGEKATNPQD